MRVLVAGATGAVGLSLIPALLSRGHVVAGLARNPGAVEPLGAQPIQADALQRDTVIRSVRDFAPDAIVHQLTALPSTMDLMRFDRVFEQTNRLRTKGTEILLEAARSAGVKRFVAQSFCGWPYARTGPLVKTEADELDPNPPARLRTTLDAIRRLETTVVGARDVAGTILRYGGFYGPHTHLGRGGSMTEQVRRRRVPVIGDGGGVWSFCHIADVASATVKAVESDATGVFNVVDDDPAPVATWLPFLAKTMGAPPPRRLPMWIARLILPEHLRAIMTEARGGSSELFRRTFDWTPKYPSWRQGFVAEFGA